MKRLSKKDHRAFASIRTTLAMLQDDAFDPKLGSHKLKGDLAGLWACSAGYDLRIVCLRSPGTRTTTKSFCLYPSAHMMRCTDRGGDNHAPQRTGRAERSS